MISQASEGAAKVSGDSLETLHWLYSIEQRAVIPIKWIVLLLALALVLIEDRSLLEKWEAPTLLGGYATINLFFSWLFIGRKIPVRDFRRWSLASLLADVVFVALMVLMTGHLESHFFVLFFFPVVRTASLFLHPFKKLGFDFLMTLLYLACAVPVAKAADPEVISAVVLRIALIWTVILTSSFLVQVLASQQARVFAINERLRYQSEQNREVLSSMTDAVMVFDPSQQLKICNRSAEDLLRKLMGVRLPVESGGYGQSPWNRYWQEPPHFFRQPSQSPLEGGEGEYRFWANLTPDLIATPIERLLEEIRFKSTGRVDSVSLTLEEKSGQKRSMVASAASIGREGETRFGWLVLLRDISEYKSLEAQLLTTERLAAVGRLAAGLAHELGNPLGIIKACANFLRKKLDAGSELSEEAEVLASESERCERILKQLLAFASQEQLRIVDIDLCEVVQRGLNLVAYQAPDTIETRLETTLSQAPVSTDENLLTQALVNLLLNAVQSISGKGSVTARLEPKDGEEWIIRIRDTGCGMGKETLARIFEPFYTTRQGGTGLGLAITQRIIHRLGGEITVQSEYGHGTEFTLVLPRRAESRDEGISNK